MFVASLAFVVAMASMHLSQSVLCRDKYGLGYKGQAWYNCTVQIAGLAIQGPTVFETKFAPTFRDYLNSVANATYGLTFEAIPLNFNQNFDRAEANTLDFIYSNPAAYTCMMVQFSVRTVASMVNLRKGNALKKFAGVIFTNVNSSFNTVEDLRKARVEAVSISGLGAMQLQQAELLKQGLDIMTDVKRLSFAYNQNKIVQDVQSGYADVGFVRTDMIDRSVAAGKTKWEYFRVIHEIPDSDFPFVRSTAFTPEWPIGSLPHVPDKIAELVGHSLMQLDASSADPALSAPAQGGNFQT
jgi:ABC-type phosphate/phosphonate transport system substrate-binding protein